MKMLRFAAAFALALFCFAAPAMAQRQAFSDAVVPQRYAIAVTPDVEAGTFTGTVRVNVHVAVSTTEITLNALDMTIQSARIDNRRATASLNAEAQTLTLSTGRIIGPGDHVIDIAYAGRIYEEAYGLFRVSYDADGGQQRLLATQFEPGDARRFAPMFDQPNMRAVFDLTVTAPADRMAVSNMPIAQTTPLRGGLQRVRFQPTPAMPSYLLFLAVGDLERIHTTTPDGVEVGVVTVRGHSEHGRFALQSAVDVLGFYKDYFGTPYPLPKLDNLGVPGAGGFGAMENWGAILYFDQFLLLDPALSGEIDRQNTFGIVAHEIAHQWFGNLVTMAWWDDLWLNEGFASWMADKATDALHPDWTPWLAATDGRNFAMDIDSRAGTHPIVQTVNTIDQANLAFDAITYQKGQAVIRMVENYIGEEAFRNGVRLYISEHHYGSARTTELWSALERASNTPITQIARDFTTQNGVPLVSVTQEACAPGAAVSRVRLTQMRFAADDVSRTGERWTIPIVAQRVGGTETARALLGADGITMEVPGGCGPVKINAGQGGYFRTLYAQADFDALVARFASLPAADQLGLMSDYWTFARTGAAPMNGFLRLASAVPANADPYVIMQASRGLRRVAEVRRAQGEDRAFDAYARGVLRPFFDRVGWTPRANEAATDAVLREALIRALGDLNDPDVVAEARRRAAASDSDPAALPGAIREAALSAVGAQADAQWYEWLLQHVLAASTTFEKDQMMSALGAAQDPALAQRSLDMALTETLPRTLRPVFIRRVAATHPDLAWAFVRAHRAEVEALLDPLQRLEFGPQIVSGSTDAARIPELAAFSANYPAEARQPVETAQAAIGVNARLRGEPMAEVSAFLAEQAAPPPPPPQPPRRRPRRPGA